VLQLVADLGNSRLKWGRLDETGQLAESIALPLDDSSAWTAVWETWARRDAGGSRWAISSVNPPLAKRLDQFLDALGDASVTWFRSAADVGVPNELAQPETAGADRAFAVAAALGLAPAGRAGLVVSCGTAITVERISKEGVWQGGAIAAGLGMTARALQQQTAQLPLVEVHRVPPWWGRSTRPALEAGVFWGTVGAVRELINRQTADLGADRWLIWTGGDSEALAREVAGSQARIEPDLVLIGVARKVFSAG
jgi:type III pantothenate kinase